MFMEMRRNAKIVSCSLFEQFCGDPTKRQDSEHGDVMIFCVDADVGSVVVVVVVVVLNLTLSPTHSDAVIPIGDFLNLAPLKLCASELHSTPLHAKTTPGFPANSKPRRSRHGSAGMQDGPGRPRGVSPPNGLVSGRDRTLCFSSTITPELSPSLRSNLHLHPARDIRSPSLSSLVLDLPRSAFSHRIIPARFLRSRDRSDSVGYRASSE
jgi:hypothetical protein